MSYRPASRKALALLHPAERGGLHTFWEARWNALNDSGVELHFAIPREAEDVTVRGVPSTFCHPMTLSRPRAAKYLVKNARHARAAFADARAVVDLAERLEATTLISHGAHFQTASIAARLDPQLRHCLLLHSDAAPRVAARVMRTIHPPDAIGFELPSTLVTFKALRTSAAETFPIDPVLNPAFRSVLDSLPVRRPTSATIPQHVGFVAALTPRKRVDRFFDVARELHRRRPGAYRFTVMGVVGDAYRRWFTEQVQGPISSLSSAGLDMSFRDGSGGAARFIPTLDYLLMTSDSEGMPNVVLEAVASGTTVVSRDLEGVRRISQRLRHAVPTDLIRIAFGPRETNTLVEHVLRPMADPSSEDVEAAREALHPLAATEGLIRILAKMDAGHPLGES